MNDMKFRSAFSLLFISALLLSCNKDSDQTGCTDPIAVNYDASALREDGSCQYNQAQQVIWSDGVRGGWNENLTEGAFRLEVCRGEVLELEQEVDSVTTAQSLFFSTGGAESHLSYFTLINEQDARDFVEGTLRFDCRIQEGAAPDFVQLFISGKLPSAGDCPQHMRSDFVEISTHSFNDSLFTTVAIPIRNFDKLLMSRVQVVCGFQFEADRNMGIEVDHIRWVANRDPE
jgi:hypothetical protein